MKREASRTTLPSKDADSAASASSAARFAFSRLSIWVSRHWRTPRWHTEQSPLCFHILTNSFSRKPFPLIFIQIAGGCHPQFPNSSPANSFPLESIVRIPVKVPPASCLPLPSMACSTPSAILYMRRIPIARAVALRYSVGSLGLRKLARRKLAGGPTTCRNDDWTKPL